jgi:hypothetical protein
MQTLGRGHERDGHGALLPPIGAQFGVGSWLRLMVGVSARPERITYRCRRGDTVIEETTESKALDASY